MFCQLTLKEVLSKHVVVKVRSNNGCFVTWLSGNLYQYIFQDIFATLLGRLKDNGFSCHLNSWSSELYQDIFLLAVVFNVEKSNGSFYHLGFFSQDISLLVWCGVQNPRGLFVFWVCISRYLFVVGSGVQNQKRLFVIVFCISIYLFVGEVWCSKPEGTFCVLSLCLKISVCWQWCSKP